MPRKVFVSDAEYRKGFLSNVHCQKEPEVGEVVELVNPTTDVLMVTGQVAQVRPDPDWTGRWIYDVTVDAEFVDA